jgi:hypothetical protein
MVDEEVQAIRNRWVHVATQIPEGAKKDISRLLSEIQRLHACCDELILEYARASADTIRDNPGSHSATISVTTSKAHAAKDRV